jgi:phosphopantetheinyl transferase (holo-ACP synthase)
MLGHAGEISFSKGIVRFELSLSHSSTNAIAFVIAIGTEQTYNINQETE